MPRIDYSYNWNNKLDCNAYSTFRLPNPNKYVVGLKYDAFLNNELHHANAEIVHIQPIQLRYVTESMALLDTGYNLQQFTAIIQRMYPEVWKKQGTQMLLWQIMFLREKPQKKVEPAPDLFTQAA